MTHTLEEFEAANKPGDQLLWKGAAAEQFARFKELRETITEASGRHVSDNVISTHTSKSIKLPVVEFTIPATGLTLTMRDNFYDVKVSVKSLKPIEDRGFGKLFDKKIAVHPTVCEGFPYGKIYGSYDANPSQFTVSVSQDDLTAFVEAVTSQAKGHVCENLKSMGLRGKKGDIQVDR